MKEDEDPAHNYWHIKNGEEFIGGIPPASHHQPGVPAHWLAYFTVSDCDSTAAEAKKLDRKSTRLNSSHQIISYAVFCLKKKKNTPPWSPRHCPGIRGDWTVPQTALRS